MKSDFLIFNLLELHKEISNFSISIQNFFKFIYFKNKKMYFLPK